MIVQLWRHSLRMWKFNLHLGAKASRTCSRHIDSSYNMQIRLTMLIFFGFICRISVNQPNICVCVCVCSPAPCASSSSSALLLFSLLLLVFPPFSRFSFVFLADFLPVNLNFNIIVDYNWNDGKYSNWWLTYRISYYYWCVWLKSLIRLKFSCWLPAESLSISVVGSYFIYTCMFFFLFLNTHTHTHILT